MVSGAPQSVGAPRRVDDGDLLRIPVDVFLSARSCANTYKREPRRIGGAHRKVRYALAIQ
jgi:hypothetical protein